MNIRERRSVQRRGWVGYLALVALFVRGITLLSGRVSMFLVVLVAALLASLFAAGFALLAGKLRLSAKERRLIAASQLP